MKFIPGAALGGNIPFLESHVHTTYSDGRSTIEEYITAALEQGVNSIIFTDHVNRNSSWFYDYVEDIRKAKKKYGKEINIYTGIEVKALDYNGTIDATDEMIASCDVVVGVVHRYPNPRGGMLDFGEVDGPLALKLENNAARGLLDKGKIHVLGHMGAMYEARYGPFPDELFQNLIIMAQKKNRVVELNGKYHKKLQKLTGYCQKYNPWVSMGSDAHEVSEIGLTYRRLKGLNNL